MKKNITITLVLMLALSLLPACSANNNSAESSSSPTDEVSATAVKTKLSYLDTLFILPDGHSYSIDTLNVGYKDELGQIKGMMLSADMDIQPLSKGIYSFQISGKVDGIDAFTFLLWNVEIEDANSTVDLSQRQLYKYTFNANNYSTYIFDEYLGIWPTPKGAKVF